MEEQIVRNETPLVSNAVAAIRELISLSSFLQGTRLPSETDLAAQIGISRPILRQALSVLKSEGVIESRRGSGTYTCGKQSTISAFGKPETIADIEDCLRFRMVVESAAAAEAAKRAERVAVNEIRAIIAEMENRTALLNEVAERDMAFHRAIARASRNRYYVMTLDYLMPHILFGLKLGRQLQSVASNLTSARVASEHRAIFEAIASGDELSAAEHMREHLNAGLQRIFGRRDW